MIGLLTNPLSQRNKEAAVKSLGAGWSVSPAVQIETLTDFSKLRGHLQRLAAANIDTLAVDGGDGTVHAVMTELLQSSSPFAKPPRLVILPGGMTNLIARDVGPKGDRFAAFNRLVQNRPLKTITRPVLELRNGSNSYYGMFCGAAAVYKSTELSRKHFHPLGAKQSIATAAGILSGLASTFFGTAPDSLRHGERISLGIDEAPEETQQCFIFLATTLDRLMLGLWPFRNEGTGPIHYLDVTAPPRLLALALPFVLFGRAFQWMRRSGYDSGRAMKFVMQIGSPLMLDGEILAIDTQLPVTITADKTLVFIQP